jgi:hypothetical protein
MPNERSFDEMDVHPVAAIGGAEVPDVPARARHAQDVAHAALAHEGGVVLVVGHSNTVPGIIAALGAPQR